MIVLTVFYETFFQRQYTAAKNSIVNRQVAVAATIEALEREMELICVTGVEDK